MSSGTSLLVVVLIFTFRMTDAGQLCGICSQIADPRDCDTIGECGDHQECFTRKYVTLTGHTVYDVGCYASYSCQATVGKRNADFDVSKLRAGNVHICSACCNDTQLCNVINGHCGSSDLTGLFLCFNCDYMHSPDQCDKVRACSVHQQCYIGQRESGLSGSLLWTSGCGHGSAGCATQTIPISGVVGKRRSPLFCSTCCSSNFCNNNCSVTNTPTTISTTTKMPESKPVITYVTRPHDVKVGSDLNLTCRATGNPTPTIQWNFFAKGSIVTTNAFVSNRGADLNIAGVTRDNYGHYACKASNFVGSDIRYVDVLEHGPL